MEIFEGLKNLFSGGMRGFEAFETIANAGPVVKGVLFVLIFFSVVSWGIILYKYFVILAARSQTRNFLRTFWTNPRLSVLYEEARQYKKSPIAFVFRAGYLEFNRVISTSRKKPPPFDEVGNPHIGNTVDAANVPLAAESIDRVLKKSIMEEITRLENHLTFLATTGSTCPFIGLFGTVWGIMNAFRGIGVKSSASIGVVASGISEALIATALGLFAAIPAVVAYNYYIGKIKVMATEMDNFSAEFLNIIERNIKKMK